MSRGDEVTNMVTPRSPISSGGRPVATVLCVLASAAAVSTIIVFWRNVNTLLDSTLTWDETCQAADKPAEEARFAAARRAMVDDQLRSRDIIDRKVLEVMGRIPREKFVPQDERRYAYDDRPVPIGHDQTISQPYIVALMTQLAVPSHSDRVLDVGVGSGYQSAVLAEMCQHVYGVEILEPLATAASQRLAKLGHKNVTVRCGDGRQGWPEHAPFQVIIVAAAADRVPQALLDQLAPGGRLVIPVGDYYQDLLLIVKRPDGTLYRRSVIPVRFVPLVE